MRALRGALACAALGCAAPAADAPVAGGAAGTAAASASAERNLEAPKGFRILGSHDFQHASDVNALAVSPDGKRLATSTQAGELLLWDIASKKQLFKVADIGAPAGQSIAFSPTGERLAVNAKGRTTVVLDATTGQTLHTISSNPIPSVFSADQLWLAMGNELFAIDLKTGRRGTTLSFDKSPVNKLAASSDGKWIAASSLEEVKVWPRTGGAPVLARTEKHPGALTFTEDSKRLAFFTSDAIKVVAVNGGQLESEIFTGSRDIVRLLVRDGQLFALSASRYEKTATIARHALGKSKAYGSEAEQSADAVAITNIGPAFIAQGGGLAALEPTTLTRSAGVGGHSARVAAVAISRDGRRLLSSGEDGLVLSWDLAASSSAPTLLGDSHDREPNAIAVSANGRFAAFATAISRSKGARVVDLGSGETVLSETTFARPTGLHFSDDETTLWLGTEYGEAQSFSLPLQARERALPLVGQSGLDHGYFDVLFFNERAIVVRERRGGAGDPAGPASSFKLPGGRPLASTFEETVHGGCSMGETLLLCPSVSRGAKQVSIIDVSTGKLVRRIDVGLAVDAVAESDAGKTLVVAERDGAPGAATASSSIATYSIADGKLVSRTAAPKLLTAIAATGQTVAFGAADGSVGTFGR